MKAATIKKAKQKVTELRDRLNRYHSPYLVEQLVKAEKKVRELESKIAGTQTKLI